MPIFASEPATTVRRHSPWLLSKRAYGAVFLAVAMAVYSGKWFSRPPAIDTQAPATAQLQIRCPNFDFQAARQEILSQARPEILEKLHIEGRVAGQDTLVSISLRDLPAQAAVPLVNVLATAYAEVCRAQRRLQLEQGYADAQHKVQQMQRKALQAQMRFELLRDRRLRALAGLSVPPPPTTVENPRWTDVSGRLADLEERKRNLLLDCTPLHPLVQEIETQIAAVRRQLVLIPPKISRDPPPAQPSNVLPADTPEAAEVSAAQREYDQSSRDLERSQIAERAALAARGEKLQIEIVAADPLPVPPSPSRPAAVTLGNAFVTAATCVVGLGMICLGASLEPSLTSVAELQSVLPVAIVGVVSAVHPSRRRIRGLLPQQVSRWAWVAAGLAVLAAVVWLISCG
jgi:hypothetical protein